MSEFAAAWIDVCHRSAHIRHAFKALRTLNAAIDEYVIIPF